MNKSTPQWQSLLQILAFLGGLTACWINMSNKVERVETGQVMDRIRYDERYIEQRELSREIKNMLQDIQTEQNSQRILIENKQNRQ